MESNPGLYELDANYSGSNGGSSCLNIYELYQVEQYEAQELFEFEQYVKIIQFAEAVRSGTHPRVRILPQPDTTAYTTLEALKAPRDVDIEPVKIRIAEVDTANDLNPTQEECKKKSRRKKGDLDQIIKKPEDLPGARYIQNPQCIISERMNCCAKNATHGRSVDLQSAPTGDSFQKISTVMETTSTEIVPNVDGCTKREASASGEMVGVDRTAKISSILAITPIEKVEDVAPRNPVVTGNSIPKLMSQAFSISNLPFQNKTTNQNFQSSTASLISTTLQHKLFQAREIQAHRAVVEGKKIEARQSIHAQEQSATAPDHVQAQRQATQDQVTQKLREQKIDIRKQIDAQRAAAQRVAIQRAAVQRSLGLDKAPPTGPRIPLGMAPRMMTSPFLNSSAPTSLLNSRPQSGLNICSPPVLGELAKVPGSALQLPESSKQNRAKKKQRVGDKDCCGKKEMRSTSEVFRDSRSGSAKGNGDGEEDEKVFEYGGEVKEDGREIGGVREDFEILKIERDMGLGSEDEADVSGKGENGGKKRKRNSHRPAKVKSAT
ncbi:hypothetical protein OCU04_005237 [Sclerotinia nivalis]|uniref:Uncharacterized protein n=1 Tax=Sclerotinia nivalis TaxID=352851 RepID=A0A9X0ANR8_9HELO|nr:hypothetical protein OCU04_005237 [Sclerotinia nivalis]